MSPVPPITTIFIFAFSFVIINLLIDLSFGRKLRMAQATLEFGPPRQITCKRSAVCRRDRDSDRLRACLRLRYEFEQVRVDEVLVSRAHAVRQAWVNLQSGTLHNLGRHKRGDSD